MLNASTVKAAKPSDKRYRLNDVRDLYLEVMPTGRKFWRYRYMKNGKRSWHTIGEYPDVTLRQAREQLPELRRRVREEETLIEEPPQDTTFKTFAAAYAKNRDALPLAESTKEIMRSYLKNYILPSLGDKEITEICPQDVLAVLNGIAEQGLDRTIDPVKRQISQIFRYAAAHGAIVYDPCTVLRDAIRPKPIKHHPFIIEPTAIGEMLRKIDAIAEKRTRLAMTFLIYSMTRTGETRNAEWREIDLERNEWRLPPEKMKMNRPHIVPMSRQLAEIIEAMRPISGNGRYIFTQCEVRDMSRPMGARTIAHRLQRIGYSQDVIVPHGFRSMASTILNENGFNSDWIERQLAHVESNAVRAAYNYADYLSDRRRMLQWYADHLDGLRGGPMNLE